METHTHLGSGSLILGFAQSVYPLSITFLHASQRVSEVPFVVRDRHGNTVLRAVSEGSFLLLRLPPGEYRVSARFDGRTLQREVKIEPLGSSHIAFEFA